MAGPPASTHADSPAARTHFLALDGLRGAAVLGVVAFHLDGRLKGGYLGVDLFFVLSGYLITGLLIAEEARTGRIDLRAFWARRARRLLPAMLALFPAIGLYAWFLTRSVHGVAAESALFADLARIRSDSFATLGYFANWRAILSRASYWDLFAAPSPLEHTWSLAIEEQFYVLWPLLFWLPHFVVQLRTRAKNREHSATLGTARRNRLLAALCMAGTLAASWWMARGYDPERTARVYFGTDTRIGAILLGAALAFFRAGRVPAFDVASGGKGRKFFDFVRLFLLPVVALGFSALLWTKLEGQDARLYRGGFLLAEFAAIVLVYACTIQEKTAVTALFSFAPLRWFGRLSYGIYLWHWPVFCALTAERTHLGFLPLSALRLALTFAIATASFHLLEEPIRREKWAVLKTVRGGLGALFGGYAVAALVVFVPTRTTIRVERLVSASERRAAESAPSANSVAMEVLPRAKFLAPNTLRVLTLGDSVSQRLGNAMRLTQDAFSITAHRPVFVADRGVGNCSIMEKRDFVLTADGHVPPLGHPDPSHGCAANWVLDTYSVRPDTTLFIIGGAFFTEMTFHAANSPADDPGERVIACDPRWQEAYRMRLDQLVDEMGTAAGEILVARTPYPTGRWRWGDIAARVDCFNGILDRFAVAHHFRQIDVAGRLCSVQAMGGPRAEKGGGEAAIEGEACTLADAGQPIRPDGLHPEGPGAVGLATWTLEQILLSH